MRTLFFLLAFLVIGMSAGCSSGGGGESTVETEGNNVNAKEALWDNMTWDVDQWS
jgi:hypothetical protein